MLVSEGRIVLILTNSSDKENNNQSVLSKFYPLTRSPRAIPPSPGVLGYSSAGVQKSSAGVEILHMLSGRVYTPDEMLSICVLPLCVPPSLHPEEIFILVIAKRQFKDQPPRLALLFSISVRQFILLPTQC